MSKSKGHIEVYLRLRPTNKYSREVGNCLNLSLFPNF